MYVVRSRRLTKTRTTLPIYALYRSASYVKSIGRNNAMQAKEWGTATTEFSLIWDDGLGGGGSFRHDRYCRWIFNLPGR